MDRDFNQIKFGSIHDYLTEFFDYYGMKKSKNALEEEWNTMAKDRFGVNDDWRMRLLNSFQSGDSESFKAIWEGYCITESVQQTTVRPLEFYLLLYFIVKNWEVDSDEKRKQRLNEFRIFLETKGELLSQISEFLPFYAFPYVVNPKNHPVYRELFGAEWAADLKKKLSAFLETIDGEEQPLPKILFLQEPDDLHRNVQLKQLQNRLVDAEKRASQAHQRFSKIQNDYQSLLGITTDLVDTLESALRGEQIQGDVLQQICSRLVATQRGTAIWPTDSFDENGALSGTVASTNDGDLFSYGATLRQSLRYGTSNSHTQNIGMGEGRATASVKLCGLNFDKIKNAFKTLDPREVWRLLQALRWRLTRVSVEQRELALTAFIANDLLELTLYSDVSPTNDTVLGICVGSASSKVVEAIARLVNAFASLARGRAYLSQNGGAVTLLTRRIFQEKEETAIRENMIGALQKLSLRGSMQTAMVELGMVEWLVDLLELTDNQSDYTLEYAVALFMNLCLRTAGKQRCVPMSNRVLKLLTDLISHENTSILSYVNGALFSILSLPELQRTAEAMDLEGILRCFMRSDQPELNRQFEFIIKQMNSVDIQSANDSNDEDDDEYDDEEDAEQMEHEIDKDDEFFEMNSRRPPFGSRAPPENRPAYPNSHGYELTGEQLLQKDYRLMKETGRGAKTGQGTQNLSLNHVQHYETESHLNGGGLLRRPSTPGRVRTGMDSQLHQSTNSKNWKSRSTPPAIPEDGAPRNNNPPTNADIMKISHDDGAKASTNTKAMSSAGSSKLENHPEYQKAFNSRPRILRTPEHRKVTASTERSLPRGDPVGTDRPGNSRSTRTRPTSGRLSMDAART